VLRLADSQHQRDCYFQSQHVAHVEKAGAAAVQPERCADSAAGKELRARRPDG